MGRSESLSKAKEFISAQGGQIAPLGLSEEELNPNEQDDLSYQAYPLESMDSCYRVDFTFPEDTLCSKFEFFEDGKQRTVQIGYIPVEYENSHVLIPVHYFIVSAVILQRKDRELKLWRQAKIREGVFIEKSLIPNPDIFEKFNKDGLDIVDIHAQGGDYYALRKKTLQEAKKIRLELETNLIADWRLSDDAKDSFLVVDGTLMNFRNEANIERCVGISKSFGTRYFSVSDHNRILTMQEFERSWVFRFHSPEDEKDALNKGKRERLSWYLRLRNRKNADPEFGLIRVEIGLKHLDNLVEMVENISRFLMSERLPISYPIPRWDKHLYPIYKCESYLSSVMTSIDTITAAMKG
jgi:hypothetical protein